MHTTTLSVRNVAHREADWYPWNAKVALQFHLLAIDHQTHTGNIGDRRVERIEVVIVEGVHIETSHIATVISDDTSQQILASTLVVD